MKKKLSFLVLFSGILLFGCSSSETDIKTAIAQTEASKPTNTFTPEPTNTPEPSPTLEPTNTNTPEPIEITFEVTFDGKGCTVSGPTEVPIGDYSFLLNNTSDSRVKLVVGQLLDGHSFQDLVDLQTEPGDNFMIEPWMSKPFYYTKDHRIYFVSLDEAGEHVISISVYNHVGIWLCIPFQVIETSAKYIMKDHVPGMV
jgi:hypothetical protein